MKMADTVGENRTLCIDNSAWIRSELLHHLELEEEEKKLNWWWCACVCARLPTQLWRPPSYSNKTEEHQPERHGKKPRKRNRETHTSWITELVLTLKGVFTSHTNISHTLANTPMYSLYSRSIQPPPPHQPYAAVLFQNLTDVKCILISLQRTLLTYSDRTLVHHADRSGLIGSSNMFIRDFKSGIHQNECSLGIGAYTTGFALGIVAKYHQLYPTL